MRYLQEDMEVIMRQLGFIICFVGFLSVGCGGGSGGGNDDVGFDDGDMMPMEMLDQGLPNAASQSLPIGSTDCAQTFTVGIAGQLTRVELRLGEGVAGTLRVDVRATTGGLPNEDDVVILGSAEVDTATIPLGFSLISFDLASANIMVTEGQVLAIVARRVSGSGTIATIQAGGTGSDYASGSAHRRPSAGTWSATSTDFGFQTFVTK